MTEKTDIGFIGIGVMGENLILNIENKGFKVSVYNRTKEKLDNFINGLDSNKKILAFDNIKNFIDSIERPRKIMLMIKAGSPVDEIINILLPFLEKGDLIIDGGNSYFQDTNRRQEFLEENGILYIGAGISGGEEGALNGPSIMVGGSEESWSIIKNIFTKIAAKTEDGEICCNLVGPKGAGHFVKMVHNGIEYGDMQLISEAYYIMKKLLKMSPDQMSKIFDKWNKEELNSYLIEITSNILKYKDLDGIYLIDKILDKAGQKGTGQWTSNTALELGVPLTLISESVFARYLSSLKDERVEASKILKTEDIKFLKNKEEFINSIKDSLYASKIISYSQGYSLLKKASVEYNWNLNYGEIAILWKGGCIIRSIFLNDIKKAFDIKKDLNNLLLDSFFIEAINKSQKGWRNVVSESQLNGVSIPAMSSALSYYDGYRNEFSSANLIQAQRDYFGAHTYERLDKNIGEFFHTNWNE